MKQARQVACRYLQEVVDFLRERLHFVAPAADLVEQVPILLANDCDLALVGVTQNVSGAVDPVVGGADVWPVRSRFAQTPTQQSIQASELPMGPPFSSTRSMESWIC